MGSRTLAREQPERQRPPPPSPNYRRPQQQASTAFNFPMESDPSTAPTDREGRVIGAPQGSLSSLTTAQMQQRRQQQGDEIGAFAREGRERQRDMEVRNRNRVQVDRREGEVGGEIPGADAFPFPMASDVAPGDAGQRRDAAIALASRVTGTPRGYLRALAMQEGMDNANARNPRSTATGYMQFTEDTWLSMMREHGGAYGLPENLRNAIQQRRGGGYYVADANARSELMALRADPEWSMIMGGHLFQREAGTIRRLTGRPVTVSDVYMGHFLGGELGGTMLRDIGRGRGNQEARAYVRRYYANRPGMAQNIIDSNPRQFAPGVTIAALRNMQTGDLIAHGERRGVPAAEMRAIVQDAPTSDITKRGSGRGRSGGGKQLMTAEQITQQANQRDWEVRTPDRDPNAARVDPETGQTQLPTREQQRLQREEEERRDREAVARNRRSYSIRRNGIRVTQPF